MKKTCLLLTIAVILALGTVALASSASYKDGYVTVSTERTGFFEIHIDGRLTYRWVGHLMPTQTFKFELSEGTHTVTLYSPDTGSATNITLVVGDGSQQGDTVPDAQSDDKAQPTPEIAHDDKEQQVEYPDGPFTMLYAEYKDGTLLYAFYGLHGYAEVWLDGKDTGRIVRKNGEHMISAELEDGEHELMLYAVSTDELVNINFTVKYVDPNIEKYGLSLIKANGESRAFSLIYEADRLIIRPQETEDYLRVRFPVSAVELMIEDGHNLIAVDYVDTHSFRLEDISSAYDSLNLDGDDWLILIALPNTTEEYVKLYAYSEAQNTILELPVSELGK